jgi:hypothetical protein
LLKKATRRKRRKRRKKKEKEGKKLDIMEKRSVNLGEGDR